MHHEPSYTSQIGRDTITEYFDMTFGGSMSRDISFWEFRERAGTGNFTSEAVSGLWNYLAIRLVSYKRSSEARADCTLPLQELLNFTPEIARKAEGVGRVRFAVYKVIYKSFLDDPSPLPSHDAEITKEALKGFAGNAYAAITVGSAWGDFARTLEVGEVPTLERLEEFCERMQGNRNRARVYIPVYADLLNEWLVYLHSQRR
jgi:hypothetical protein